MEMTDELGGGGVGRRLSDSSRVGRRGREGGGVEAGRTNSILRPRSLTFKALTRLLHKGEFIRSTSGMSIFKIYNLSMYGITASRITTDMSAISGTII